MKRVWKKRRNKNCLKRDLKLAHGHDVRKKRRRRSVQRKSARRMRSEPATHLGGLPVYALSTLPSWIVSKNVIGEKPHSETARALPRKLAWKV
jgi:hypothetical protein